MAETPTEDEQAIRALVERWARAVHAGELDTVLADHAGDIVMFDVPPPHDGVRGIEDYAATWPGFFAWQASGASFEIVSLEATAAAAAPSPPPLLAAAAPTDPPRAPARRRP